MCVKNIKDFGLKITAGNKVGSGLQVQGCRPHLMKASLDALEAMMESSLPEAFVLDLLPRREECSPSCNVFEARGSMTGRAHHHVCS